MQERGGRPRAPGRELRRHAARDDPAFVLDMLGAVDGDELSMTQLATLHLLDGGDPVSLGALAERVGRSVSAQESLVDGLVRRGPGRAPGAPGPARWTSPSGTSPSACATTRPPWLTPFSPCTAAARSRRSPSASRAGPTTRRTCSACWPTTCGSTTPSAPRTRSSPAAPSRPRRSSPSWPPAPVGCGAASSRSRSTGSVTWRGCGICRSTGWPRCSAPPGPSSRPWVPSWPPGVCSTTPTTCSP